MILFFFAIDESIFFALLIDEEHCSKQELFFIYTNSYLNKVALNSYTISCTCAHPP